MVSSEARGSPSSISPKRTPMSSPDQENASADKLEVSRATSFFEGDTGELRLETRRALVQLLIGPSIDGKRQQKLWTTLIRDEAVIALRLFDLFLTLVVDPEAQ